MSKKIFFLFFLFFSVCDIYGEIIPPGAFSSSARGSTALNILESPVSPEFFSFGGAGSTVYSHDSIFYNPAGAGTGSNSSSVFFDFQTLNSDARRSDISYLKRNDDIVNGFYISYIDYGDFTEVDSNGTIKGSFSPYDYILNYSFSKGIKNRFGVNLKYVYSNMVFESAKTLAADVGFILKGNKTYYSFLVRNFGVPVKIYGRSYPLPLEIIAGVRYVYSNNLSGIFDLKMPVNNTPYPAAGVEYKKVFGDILVRFRGGINLNNRKYLGWGSVFSGGFGIDFGSFNLDYGFIPYSNVDMSHKIALSMRFGELKKNQSKINNNFVDFMAEETESKSRTVVFDFQSDGSDNAAGSVISDLIEQRLLDKKHVLITRLDPLYLSNLKRAPKNLSDVKELARNIDADYAVWGQMKKDQGKTNFNLFILDVKNNDVHQFEMLADISNINDVAFRLSEEVSKKIK
ncbi:MAG: hypothetical protein GX445_05255 [Elusimicrobia bacterium]|nr:hypothetical protein [Elusimicrobiota bacterium]